MTVFFFVFVYLYTAWLLFRTLCGVCCIWFSILVVVVVMLLSVSSQSTRRMPAKYKIFKLMLAGKCARPSSTPNQHCAGNGWGAGRDVVDATFFVQLPALINQLQTNYIISSWLCCFGLVEWMSNWAPERLSVSVLVVNITFYTLRLSELCCWHDATLSGYF